MADWSVSRRSADRNIVIVVIAVCRPDHDNGLSTVALVLYLIRQVAPHASVVGHMLNRTFDVVFIYIRRVPSWSGGTRPMVRRRGGGRG